MFWVYQIFAGKIIIQKTAPMDIGAVFVRMKFKHLYNLQGAFYV